MAHLLGQSKLPPPESDDSKPNPQILIPADLLKKKSRKDVLAAFPEPPMCVRGETTRYERQGFLGGGAFGRCYLVTTPTGARFALKAVPKASLTSDYAKQKLYSEIQIQRHLRNENIVRLYEDFEDGENIYLILELCENKTLLEYIKKRGRLTEPEVRFFMYKIFQGLYHLHQRNIMHRDLKLCNLLLTHDMDLKLGDFGLATMAEEEEKMKSFCGTPHYLAPEILRHGGYSFEVDVWATGVIMYTLLAGKTPFTFSKNQQEMYRKIRRNEYTIPENLNLSPEATSLVKDLLCANPQLRPTILQASRHPFFTTLFMPKSIPVWALHRAPVWSNGGVPIMTENAERPNGTDSRKTEIRKPLGEVNLNAAPRKRAIAPASSNKPAYIPQQLKLNIVPDSTPKKPSTPVYETSSPKSGPVLSSETTNRLKALSPLHAKGPNYTSHKSPLSIPPINRSDEISSATTYRVRSNPSPPSIERPQTKSSTTKPPRSPVERKAVHKNTSSVLAATILDPQKAPNTSSTPKKPVATPTDELYRGDIPLSRAGACNSSSKSLIATVYTLILGYFDKLAIDTPRSPSRPHSVPTNKVMASNLIFVSKWIDYSQKYGLGYQLSDGSSGVYFNDGSTMLIAANNQRIEYLEFVRRHSKIMMQRHGFDREHVPEQIEKKWKLFNHFKTYMQVKLYQAAIYIFEDEGRSSSLEFVVRHHRHKYGVIFRLSNGVVQINFYDHQKYIFANSGASLTIIDKGKPPRTYNLCDLFDTSAEPPMKEARVRLRYALCVMEGMLHEKDKKALQRTKNT